MDFVDMRMNHMMIKKEDTRINIDAYPKRALFEGVVNAVVHRDYFIDGSQIQIDMFKDRLEISSPGGFYKGKRLEKTYDLSGLISKRRNELIAGVLVLCNVMEAAGTGFDKIMEEYKNVDSKHKPYVYSTSQQFTLVLPDLTYDAGVEDLEVPTLHFVRVPNGTELDGRGLSFCYRKERKASEIAKYLGISDSTYFRKRILENLVMNGYLTLSKIGNAAAFRTKPEKVSLD